MNASAWAAWVGAGLGLVNFIIGLFSRRPVFNLLPDEEAIRGSFDPNAVRICVVAGATPLLVRSVDILPTRDGINVSDLDSKGRDGMGRAARWGLRGGFCKIIPAGTTGWIGVNGFQSGPHRVLVIRWSDQRFQPLPWSIFLITPKRLREFAQAASGVHEQD